MKLISVLFIISVFLITASRMWKPTLIHEKRILIPPPPNLEFLSFGYQMPIADSLWIRSLQDFDYCENLLAKNLCEGNGWLSQTLDAVTNLAPDYQIAYRTGGLALTVLVSDYPGATRIFDKGVRMFPNDEQLLYRAGYHAMIEEKNNEKAADLFIRAAKLGAPGWLYSLGSRLYTDAGKKELSEKLYQELVNQGTSEKLLARIREKIDSTK